jgi:hypothetical protein
LKSVQQILVDKGISMKIIGSIAVVIAIASFASGNLHAVEAIYIGSVESRVVAPSRIMRLDPETGALTEAITIDYPARLVGMAIDEPNGKVTGYRLNRFNTDGTGIEGVPAGLQINRWGLKVVPALGKLFMTGGQANPQTQIASVGLDKTGFEQLIPYNNNLVVHFPRQIDVDVSAQKLFWANSASTTDPAFVGVWSADLDGESPQQIVGVPNSRHFPTGVQVDSVEGKVYWTQRPYDDVIGYSPAEIWRADLDGTNREFVAAAPTSNYIFVQLYVLQTEVIVGDSDGDGVSGNDDLCPDENASGYDFDQDGCIDSPEESTDELAVVVEEFLNNGTLNTWEFIHLHSALDGAQKLMEKGNLKAAEDKLDKFKKKVNRLVRRGTLTQEQGEYFLAAADAILAVLYL